jgi:hypothetical protein
VVERAMKDGNSSRVAFQKYFWNLLPQMTKELSLNTLPAVFERALERPKHTKTMYRE